MAKQAPEFQKFQKLTDKLLKVSHEDIKKKLEAEKKAKVHSKKRLPYSTN